MSVNGGGASSLSVWQNGDDMQHVSGHTKEFTAGLSSICGCEKCWSLWQCVCVCVKGILTDAGAEVSILSVGPVVVGVAVVAAHRLQLDLLDLHGLCDGCVGSCCRRRCQAWRENAEETEHLPTATCLLGLSHCTCKTFQEATLANERTQWKRIFLNKKTMNNFVYYRE